jgi:hypothetical protein
MSDSKAADPLPHNARGIDLGDFVMLFCADKIIVTRKTGGDHFTLHSGYKSGVIDLHRTWKDDQGSEQHTTIFAMRRDNIPALLRELNSLPQSLGRLLRPLRLGWLGRRGIGIAWGVLPTDEEHINRVSDREKLLCGIYSPEYLDEVRWQPDGQFTLWRNGRMIGIAFKSTDLHGNARLAWMKSQDLQRFQGQVWCLIREVAMRYAIPENDYHNYAFLQGTGSASIEISKPDKT